MDVLHHPNSNVSEHALSHPKLDVFFFFYKPNLDDSECVSNFLYVIQKWVFCTIHFGWLCIFQNWTFCIWMILNILVMDYTKHPFSYDLHDHPNLDDFIFTFQFYRGENRHNYIIQIWMIFHNIDKSSKICVDHKLSIFGV